MTRAGEIVRHCVGRYAYIEPANRRAGQYAKLLGVRNYSCIRRCPAQY
jgi:hypothetical protein